MKNIWQSVDVFNLFYIFKPPTFLARWNGNNNGPRWVLCKGEWKPKIKKKKSFKISLVVDKFFKARTWRYSNIQTGKCSLIIFFSPFFCFFLSPNLFGGLGGGGGSRGLR